ncbi:MAG: Gx transporter family protein, partial [Lachnospiraceae bacterium]|nr:Gx transporter family protein [Lachnospiraceae bacterium]
MSSKKVATIGMMIALAFVLNYVETLIPVNIGIPGVKLGISNIVVIFSLYTLGPATAFFIAIIRIVLCGLTFGSISSMIYSLAGGLLSYLVMFLLKKTDRFSIYGVSV